MRASAALQRRNRGFEATHQALIETAVQIISDRGVDTLSVSEVARLAGINRTTVYYHFDSREALLRAVKDWSADQLASGMGVDLLHEERVAFITRFVVERPALIKLWLEEFLSEGDIRDRYPQWDALVDGVGDLLKADDDPADPRDAEIFCVMMLTATFIAPRIFRNSIRPDMPLEELVDRFRKAYRHMLRCNGLNAG